MKKLDLEIKLFKMNSNWSLVNLFQAFVQNSILLKNCAEITIWLFSIPETYGFDYGPFIYDCDDELCEQ